jgi:hypothetical protein
MPASLVGATPSDAAGAMTSDAGWCKTRFAVLVQDTLSLAGAKPSSQSAEAQVLLVSLFVLAAMSMAVWALMSTRTS